MQGRVGHEDDPHVAILLDVPAIEPLREYDGRVGVVEVVVAAGRDVVVVRGAAGYAYVW